MDTNATKSKFVYSFKEGDGQNKKLLGGKGANLCEMTQIGINVRSRPASATWIPRTASCHPA